MDRALADSWNALVKPEDTVYHLGDFALGHPASAIKMLQHLKGRKVLIKGNHDKQVQRITGPGLFEEVHEQLVVEVGERRVLLCHYPYRPEGASLDHLRETAEKEGWNFQRYLGRMPVYKGMFSLCGHVHQKWTWQGKSFNVGVDVHNFKPLSEEQVAAAILERQGESE